PRLADSEREAALEDARAAIEEVDGSRYLEEKAELLAKLVSIMPPSQREEGVQRALAEMNNLFRLDQHLPVLVYLAPFLPEETIEDIMFEAAKKAQPYRIGGVLSTLAPQLPQRVVLNLLVSLRLTYLTTERGVELFRRIPEPRLRLYFW